MKEIVRPAGQRGKTDPGRWWEQHLQKPGTSRVRGTQKKVRHRSRVTEGVRLLVTQLDPEVDKTRVQVTFRRPQLQVRLWGGNLDPCGTFKSFLKWNSLNVRHLGTQFPNTLPLPISSWKGLVRSRPEVSFYR